MPDLTTHLFFSMKLYNEILYKTNKSKFLLGVIAPDCILTEDFIKKSHFLNNEAKIEIETLKNLKSQLHNLDPSYSFYLGYLTHLYLDYYFDKYSNEIFLLNIKSKESKINILKKIKNYNMQHNKHLLNNYDECISDLKYEYINQADAKLKDLISFNTEFEVNDDFEELTNYISLINKIALEFEEDFNMQNVDQCL